MSGFSHLKRLIAVSALAAGVLFVVPSLGAVEHGSPWLCFPSCAEADGRFLSVSEDPQSFAAQTLAFTVWAGPSSASLNLSVFDANRTGFWDNANAPDLLFKVYRDPAGDGSGRFTPANLITTLDTQATTTTDNGWTEVGPIANSTQGVTSPGCVDDCPYQYVLEVAIVPGSSGGIGGNQFKLRTDGTIGLQGQVFAFYSPPATALLWPLGASQAATAYDGRWTFALELEAPTTSIEFWDGDFDYGDTLCASLDTDDLSTPADDPNAPGFNLFPFTVPSAATIFPEGVAVGNATTCSPSGIGVGTPADNTGIANRIRSPLPQYGKNILFRLIDPNGVEYLNANPSGNGEWERFTVSTEPFNAAEMDYHAPSLPLGVYEVDLQGLDLANLNFWYFDYDLVGVPPNGPPGSRRAFYRIGRLVWYDSDDDGTFDEGEPVIPNVTVTVHDEFGGTQFATTDANGEFFFRKPKGNYTVVVDAANFAAGKPLFGLRSTTGGEVEEDVEVGPSPLPAYDEAIFGYVQNQGPEAEDDAALCLCTGATTVDVLANDNDPDNDTLTVTAVTQPSNGVTVLNANGTVTYTPTSGFLGVDTFSYTITDGFEHSATGTVTITNTNNAPVLETDSATTQPSTPVTIAVLANDSDVDATQALTVSSITQAGNGTVVLNANGTVTYTPNAGFAGTDTFTYTVTDGCAEVTTTVTVTVNAPPTPVDDAAACLCTGNTTLDLLANDTDANNDTLAITAITQPAHGTVVLAADNRTVTYTTTGGFVGVDTFTYTVGDGHGGTATGTVTITNTNNAPVLVADSASTQAVTPVTITVLGNDTDADGQTLSVSSITQAGNGTVVLNANGTVTYTPNAGFAGTDTFTYTVTDGCAEVTTTVTVMVNAPPTPVDDAAACLCTGNTTLDLLANDTDANNDTLAITAITQPAHGTVVLAADNRTVTYTTTGGFVGVDTFTYTVGDGHGGTAVGTVTITNTNNAPVLVADSASTQAVTPVTITVLANDTDADGQTLSVSSITQAGNGTVVLNANGTVTYTPNAGFAGTDTFTYTVTDGCAEVTTTVTVTVNAPPTPVDDAAACLCTGNTTLDLLANDTDANNDTLAITAITQPAHGTVVLAADNRTVTYTTTGGFVGVDTFTYTVGDGHGGTATGTVTITNTNNAPVLVADSASTQAVTPVTITVLGNDTDADGQTLSVSSITQAGNGTVVLNANGTVTYTPNAGFAGTDTFTYTVTDGCAEVTTTVTVTVNAPPTPVDDAAACLCTGNTTLDLLANDTDANNDTLAITAITQPAHGTVVLAADNRTVTYTTTGGFVGVDTFTYTVGDGHGGTATGTVTITNTNNAPVLVADSASTQAVTPVTITVLGNDTDADGQTLSVSSITQAGNGTVVLNANGTVTYTPNAGFAGTDTFTYTVTDGCAEVTTTVTVTVNAPPTPVDDAAACLCTGNTTLDLLANDTDANNDTLAITAITQPAHGTVVLAADNRTVTYTTTGGFVGVDTFTYTVGDGHGGTAVGTVTITNTNNAPVLVADSASTQAVTPVTITVLGNDTDADGQTLSVSSITQAGNGTVVLNANGTVTYTPNAGFAGTDTFTYTVTDGCAEVTTTVTVTVNAPPTPVDDAAACLCTGNTTLDLLANDTDANNDTLAITAITQPAHGTVVLAADNRTVTYTTTGGFVGVDTFTYTVGDGHGGTATGTVTITNTNNAPGLVADSASTQAVTPVTITVLANDTDADGQTLSVSSITQAGNGTVVLNANGTVTYTPNAGFAGTDTFTYTVTDGCAEVTTTVTVTVNAPPTPVDDAAACLCTGNTMLDLLANDTDANNDTLAITAITQPAHGTVVLAADNRTVTYTTTGGFVGVDTFTYTVGDGHGGTATGTVTITNTNNAPVLVADNTSTVAGSAVTINVLANDSDADGQTLTVTAHTSPVNGTLVQNPDGTFVYTPNEGFRGTDSFTYTVSDGCDERTTTVTISVTNRPPSPSNDTGLCLCTGDTTINVLTNDDDPDNDSLTVTAVTQPSHGTVTFTADGNVKYTPTDGFVGTDTFTYTVSDGQGDTATGTVTVESQNQAPVAVDDAATVVYQTATTIDVAANDSDPDGTAVTVVSVTQAAHGTVVVNANGTVTYTPEAGYFGSDQFTYTLKDECGAEVVGVVRITIPEPVISVSAAAICVNDAPYVNFSISASNFTPLPGAPVTLQWKDSTGAIVQTTTLSWTNTSAPLTGQVLWPGATVDASGTPTDWPGWLFTAGQWVPGSDGFENTRPTATVEVSVNPTASVVVSYPPPTAACASPSRPAITLIKKTNGTDNNTAPGIEVVVGSTVTWTYLITNTGNVPLTNVTLTDDKIGAVACPVSSLNAGASTTCTATGIAIEGQYTNMGTVTGRPPVGPDVSAKDPDNYFGKTPPPCEVNGYTTFSQGGWGSKPNGNNPGRLLATHFATVYPNGLTLGGGKTLKFTSAKSIEDYLPAGGGAAVLTSSEVNPKKSAGVLSAQLLAVQLAVDFSRAGVLKEGLGALVFTSGPVAGQSLTQVLAMANAVLGGNTSALPSGMTLSGLASVLESVVDNYHEGTVNGGLLGCGTSTPPPPPPPPTDPPTDPPPATGSGVCSGGVTKLVLKYIGSGSPNGVVSGQRSAPGKGPLVAAQISGSSPLLYTFATTEMGGQFDSVAGGRLANNLTVFIGNTKIGDVHTSCSVPIYPGMKIGGQFEIVQVWTKGGGLY